MSDDKVVKMPGVHNTDEPILTDAHLATEEALVQDITGWKIIGSIEISAFVMSR